METKRKVITGSVISKKMDKTAVVAVEKLRRHPLYRKMMRKVKKYKAHDEKNEAGVGDVVKLIETRPVSKDKRWKVIEIVSKGEVPEVKPEEIK
jgi:small subunit ribosomal protein S17